MSKVLIFESDAALLSAYRDLIKKEKIDGLVAAFPEVASRAIDGVYTDDSKVEIFRTNLETEADLAFSANLISRALSKGIKVEIGTSSPVRDIAYGLRGKSFTEDQIQQIRIVPINEEESTWELTISGKSFAISKSNPERQ